MSVAGGVFLIVVGVALTILMRHAEPILRSLIVGRLETQFHAKVELDSFHISVVNGLWAEGKGLRVWPPADLAQDSAMGKAATGRDTPLIQLAEFRFHAPLHYTPGMPIRIPKVELQGVVIDVPARQHAAQQEPEKTQEIENAQEQQTETAGEKDSGKVQFVVDRVECKRAQLTMETNKPGKLPLEFAIDRIVLTHVSMTGPMGFNAVLTNPQPKGEISTKGNFGPWVVEDPGASKLEGTYTFSNADLGTFKGIGGIMDSTGSYRGVLRELQVDGEAKVPRFELSSFGTGVPLDTKFHAKVDGTNGDTWLEPVDATLGRSHFSAQGSVVQVPGSGHDIALNVNVDRGRIEDFLRLASHTGNPMLTGDVKVKAKLDLGPGAEKVEKRLKLKGNFILDDAKFTSAKVQHDIGELSLRGEGKPQELKSADVQTVKSAMRGDFTMANGKITLPHLQYTVPGAEIDLAGTYGVEDGTLGFTGNARMQATVSQMVGGWKGALLKPVDPFFKKKGAGAQIPIHVDGTREDPHFGLNLGK